MAELRGGAVPAEASGSARAPVLQQGLAAVERVDLDRVAPALLGAAVFISGLLLYHLTRGSSFWGDDWAWVVGRRGNDLHTFLAPYDGHLSVLPVAIYKIMFGVFGAHSYAPYRAMVIGFSLLVGLLTFEYARHRVGRFPAVIAAGLVLFEGPGWQDTMWAFQIGWELALGLGLAALILLDRRTRRADLLACALTFAAICSTSFGVTFALAIALDVALTRRRWRDAWIPGGPLLLYAVWAAHYHPTGIQWSEITLVPGNIVQTLAGGIAGPLGLSGANPLDPVGTNLTFGAPLLVVLILIAARRAFAGRLAPRAWTLLVALVLFSTLTTLGRAFETPLVSRYIYPDCVLMTLFVVELARGLRLAPRVQFGAAALALLAIASNIGMLRQAGVYLRQVGTSTNADIGALEIGRGYLPAGHVASQLPDYPFVAITAGQYYAARNALGSPADSVAQIAAAPGLARSVADNELVSGQALILSPGTSPKGPSGAAPQAAGASGASAHAAGPCLRIVPLPAVASGQTSSATLALAPGALRVTAGPAPVTVSTRRFGPSPVHLGTIGADRSAIVIVRRDAASTPWLLELASTATLRACTLG